MVGLSCNHPCIILYSLVKYSLHTIRLYILHYYNFWKARPVGIVSIPRQHNLDAFVSLQFLELRGIFCIVKSELWISFSISFQQYIVCEFEENLLLHNSQRLLCEPLSNVFSKVCEFSNFRIIGHILYS